MRVRQLVFVEKNKAVIELRSISIDKPTECLIRNDYTMLSPGTELALWSGTHIGFGDPDIPWARYPVYPGYAAVGWVAEAGPTSGLKAGELVLHYGPHAEASVLDAAAAHWARIPEGGDPRRFLLTRFAQIAYSALAAAKSAPKRVAVYGAGIVGNLCAQLFTKVPGVEEVFAIDLSPRRREIAEACGLRSAASAAGLGGAPDTVVEATGAPAVIVEALKFIAARGQLLLLGSSRGPAEVNFYKYVHRKLVSVIGAHETVLPTFDDAGLEPPRLGSWRTQKAAIAGLIEMIAGSALEVSPFLGATIPPEGAQGAYEGLRDRPDENLGVFLDWRAGGS